MEVFKVQLGHDHPLMLIKKEETDDSWDLCCYGCQQPILDSYSSCYYGCKPCRFFLDKTCAELPPEMIHPFHPPHPLTLRPNPPSTTHTCDVCRGSCKRFIYRCSPCDYDVDIRCASVVLSIQQSIKHTSHPHQLIALQKESMFFCDACGEEHKGSSFLCTTCGFWINQKCASSPLTVKLNKHHHTLLLVSVLSQKDYLEVHRSPICKICSKELARRSWLYCCSECSYFVHLHCATSEKEHSMVYKTETENHNLLVTATSNAELSKVHIAELDLSLIYLPVSDDRADLITQFIKNIRIQGKHKEAAEIKLGTHDHPLTFFESPIDHAASYMCCGCAKSISCPFYHCVQCNFFLHVHCAELPDVLQHPGHPEHTLFLSTGNFSRCKCCDQESNLFYYECKNCEFTIDYKCACLPRAIKHESHKHILALRPTGSTICISCNIPLDMSFECGSCTFNLCVSCALLPSTIRHRYDKHPFNLTYSPLPYETEDDFCEICEEGIDSKLWFYHCGECDQSLHTNCIFPLYEDENMIYGHCIDTGKHPHRLTYVGLEPMEDFSCSLCNSKNLINVFVCLQCKFYMCVECYIYDYWNSIHR